MAYAHNETHARKMADFSDYFGLRSPAIQKKISLKKGIP